MSLGLLVAALFFVAIPCASAQPGPGTPVASGTFTASVGLDGGFSVDIPGGGELTCHPGSEAGRGQRGCLDAALKPLDVIIAAGVRFHR
jgi:hypothetical protein